MENEIVQAYSTRITQANRSELVVITFEIIVEELKAAKKAYSKQNIPIFETELKRAQKFLHELMASLDYQYRISQELILLYQYVNKQIITAMMKQVQEPLEVAQRVITGLLTGFREVSKQDSSGALMRNTQKLYAGLTYGKGSLNETFIDSNEARRGFKA